VLDFKFQGRVELDVASKVSTKVALYLISDFLPHLNVALGYMLSQRIMSRFEMVA